MIITDCHVHSCFSSDSETPVEAMIEQAIAKNFSYFYLTDHMDYEFPIYEEGMDFLFNVNEYFAKLEMLKSKYKSSKLGFAPPNNSPGKVNASNTKKAIDAFNICSKKLKKKEESKINGLFESCLRHSAFCIITLIVLIVVFFGSRTTRSFPPRYIIN